MARRRAKKAHTAPHGMLGTANSIVNAMLISKAFQSSDAAQKASMSLAPPSLTFGLSAWNSIARIKFRGLAPSTSPAAFVRLVALLNAK